MVDEVKQLNVEFGDNFSAGANAAASATDKFTVAVTANDEAVKRRSKSGDTLKKQYDDEAMLASKLSQVTAKYAKDLEDLEKNVSDLTEREKLRQNILAQQQITIDKVTASVQRTADGWAAANAAAGNATSIMNGYALAIQGAVNSFDILGQALSRGTAQVNWNKALGVQEFTELSTGIVSDYESLWQDLGQIVQDRQVRIAAQAQQAVAAATGIQYWGSLSEQVIADYESLWENLLAEQERGIATARQQSTQMNAAFSNFMGVQSSSQQQTTFQSSAADVDAFAAELDRLQAKYDPVFAATQKYEAAVAELDQLYKAGVLSSEVYVDALSGQEKAFKASTASLAGNKNAVLDTSGATLAAADSTDHYTSAMSHCNMGMNELIHTGRATWDMLAAGMPVQQIIATQSMQAAQAFNLMGFSLQTVLLTVAGVAAFAVTVGALVARMTELNSEIRQFQTASKAFNNQALSPTTLQDMSRSMSSGTSFDRSTTTSAIALLQSYRTMAIDTFNDIAQAAPRMATTTGKSLSDVTKDLADASTKGYAGIEKLNEAYGMLSPSQMQYVLELETAGKNTEAFTIAIGALNSQMGAAAITAETGLKKAWTGFADDFSKTLDMIVQSDDFKQVMQFLNWTGNGLKGLVGSPGSVTTDPYLQAMNRVENAQNTVGYLSGQTGNAPKDYRVSSDLVEAQKELQDAREALAVQEEAMRKRSADAATAEAAAKVKADQQASAADQTAAQAMTTSYGEMAAAMALPTAAREKAMIEAQADEKFKDQTNSNEQKRAYVAGEMAKINAELAGRTADLVVANKADAASSSVVATAYGVSTAAGIRATAMQAALVQEKQRQISAGSAAIVAESALEKAYEDSRKAVAEYVAQQELDITSKQRLAQAAAQGTTALRDQQAQEVAIAKTQDELNKLNAEYDNGQSAMDETTYFSRINDLLHQRSLIYQNEISGQVADDLNAANQQYTTLVAQYQTARLDADIAKQKTPEMASQLAYQKAILQAQTDGKHLDDESVQAAIERNAKLQGQIAAQQQYNQNFQQAVTDIANRWDTIGTSISTKIVDNMTGAGQRGGESLVMGLKKQLDAWLVSLPMQFLKTQLILPVTAQLVSAMPQAFGLGSSSGSASSGLGSLVSLGGTTSSVSGLFGGPTIGSTLGLTGSNGLFSTIGTTINGWGADLFGTATGSGLGGQTLYAVGETASGETIFSTNAGSALAGSGSLAGSGATFLGTAAGALGTVGGGVLAGNLIGGAIGTGAGGALGGAAGGAATGAAIGSVVPGLGTAVGAIVGGIAGAISGWFSGLAPQADNSNTWVGISNGQASITNEVQSHGGSQSTTDSMANAYTTSLNQIAQQLGASLQPDDLAANFGYTAKYNKYYDGGTGYDSATDAVNAALSQALTDPSMWKNISDNVKSAMEHSVGDTIDQITTNLDFANDFDSSIQSMNSGVIDFTKSAQAAALAAGTQLTTSVENFKSQTEALGLDTQAAADATKNAVEVFLGLKSTQAISDAEQKVETLYGDLQGVTGLMDDVGISYEDAAASVKAQVEQLLGITSAAPATSALDQQIAGIEQTFSDLAPILKDLGISADDAAAAMQKQIDAAKATAAAADQAAIWTAQGNDALNQLSTVFSNLSGGSIDQTVATAQETGILNGMTPDQIGLAVSAFGDASKVGADAATSFLSLAASVVASKEAAEKNSAAVQTASDSLSFFTNIAKSLGDYIAGMDTSSDSPLSPEDQYNTAKQQFESDQTAALGGDQDAMGRLQSDAQAFEAASRAYNASNAQYSADYAAIKAGLSQAASYAQSQASTEQQILDTLNTSVLSQLQAIENAINAQSAANNPPTEKGAPVAYSGGNPLNVIGMTDAQITGAITSLYQNVLGVQTPDAEGLAYWVNDYKSGDTFSNIAADFDTVAQQQSGMRLGGVVGAYAGGGVVGNGLWDVDSVLARYAGGGSIALAGGEFVTRAPSVNNATYATLDHINRTGSLPTIANNNSALEAKMDRMIDLFGTLLGVTAKSGDNMLTYLARLADASEGQLAKTKLSQMRPTRRAAA